MEVCERDLIALVICFRLYDAHVIAFLEFGSFCFSIVVGFVFHVALHCIFEYFSENQFCLLKYFLCNLRIRD